MSSLETESPTLRHEHSSQSAPRWTVPVVVIASVLGLAGLGVAAYAVATQPAKARVRRDHRDPRARRDPRVSKDLLAKRDQEARWPRRA